MAPRLRDQTARNEVKQCLYTLCFSAEGLLLLLRTNQLEPAAAARRPLRIRVLAKRAVRVPSLLDTMRCVHRMPGQVRAEGSIGYGQSPY